MQDLSSPLLNSDDIVTTERETVLYAAARKYLEESLSPATRKAYATDWESFTAFCRRFNRAALPADPETVALYLAEQAETGLAPSTLGRRAAAVKHVHESADLPDPTAHKALTALLQGVRRDNAARPIARKKPTDPSMIADMIACCETETLTGLRDKAVILFGFSGAFRRSELCALNVEDLEETPEGLRVTIRQSKTDQEGAGQVIALPRGNVFKISDCIKEWLHAARIAEGALFRAIPKGGKYAANRLTPLSINLIIKKYVKKAGFNPDEYGAHSLRSGFLTAAAEHGASVFKMTEVSRHKRLDTLSGYVRNADLFKNHAGEGFL